MIRCTNTTTCTAHKDVTEAARAGWKNANGKWWCPRCWFAKADE